MLEFPFRLKELHQVHGNEGLGRKQPEQVLWFPLFADFSIYLGMSKGHSSQENSSIVPDPLRIARTQEYIYNPSLPNLLYLIHQNL